MRWLEYERRNRRIIDGEMMEKVDMSSMKDVLKLEAAHLERR